MWYVEQHNRKWQLNTTPTDVAYRRYGPSWHRLKKIGWCIAAPGHYLITSTDNNLENMIYNMVSQITKKVYAIQLSFIIRVYYQTIGFSLAYLTMLTFCYVQA